MSIDWSSIGVIVTIYTAVSAVGVGIANKIFKLGQTTEKINNLEASINNDIKPDISNISSRIDDLMKILAHKP